VVNLLKPFEIILSGLKYTFKGIRWGLNRPEAEFAVLLLPFVGQVKAAFVLSKMLTAEELFTTGSLKLSWVLQQVRLAEKLGHIDIDDMTDSELYKLITTMVPIAEGMGYLVAGEAD
jgi:hypothetical protein